ncbi:MAG TPA: YdbL family protein [Xanthomonadaceae bacterium]|nr:YdbL family protein [Xanthomonadaceae bacterium]
MKRLMGMPVMAALVLSACVTINVYFPAAEAKEAAKQFVEKVIGPDAEQPAPPAPAEKKDGGGMAAEFHFDPLMLLGIGQAQAQAQDFKLDSPAVQAIESRIDARFDSQLRGGFEAGALGFSGDGLVVVRDATKLQLKDRVAVNTAVADDNRDRKALYREAAVANGHPEWEGQIRQVFAKQWIAAAHKGWWYQDASGAWKQK